MYITVYVFEAFCCLVLLLQSAVLLWNWYWTVTQQLSAVYQVYIGNKGSVTKKYDLIKIQ